MPDLMNHLRGAGSLSAARRWLFVLLLVVVPFQFAWSAASGYCRHEAGTATGHFGHHDHQSKAQHGDKSHDVKLKQIADGDDNCISCHASAAQVGTDTVPALIAMSSVHPPQSGPPGYRSPIPLGLERPARRVAI